MSVVLYEEYLKSKDWKIKCQETKERDGNRCQTCLSADELGVHHKTYERFGNELPEDLITLCRECHAAITDSIRRRRYSGRKIEASDMERLTPTQKGEDGDDVQDVNVQDSRRVTPTYAQRSDG